MYSKNLIFILVSVFFLFAFRSVNAAPGDLDLSFGTNGTGIITTPIKHSDGTNGGAVALESIIQPDDKIIAVGSVLSPQSIATPNYDIVIVRYNADGTLDNTFGSGGKVIARVNTSSSEEAYAVALQPDGKILVGGYAIVTYSYSGTRRFFALWRFNANGTPDYSFGTAGKTLIEGYLKDYWRSNAAIGSLAVQTDGKIVAVGVDRVFNETSAVIRYHPNGAVDTSFNNGATGGKYYFIPGGYESGAAAVAQQSDGELIIAGRGRARNQAYDFAAVRFNSLYSTAGTIDSTTLTNLSTSGVDMAFAVAVQPDDKFVLVGLTYTYDFTKSDFALARYNADGTPDETFGYLGTTAFDIANSEDWGRSVLIQTDGKIVAAGLSTINSKKHFSLARFNEDGSTDFGFGEFGKVTTSLGNTAEIFWINTQSDGKIVAVGGAGGNFALARYEN